MLVIDAVLKDDGGALLRPLHVLALGLRARVAAAAAARSVDLSSVYRWVHQFWARGSVANGLMPDLPNCGAPGKQKAQNNPLGRKPKHRDIPAGQSKYVLTDECKRKLAFCFEMIGASLSEKEAFELSLSMFWAKHVEDPITGERSAEWFPHWMRPTPDQFVRWGQIGTGKTVTQLLTPARDWKRSKTARGGSEQDMVAAFGQQGAFDGTSTDLYLARARNRLLKLPPLTRLVLRETRLGIIYGFHISWDAPSPATAALAILCGADQDKHVWMKERYGLDVAPGAIPGILCRNILADNGELKAHAATEGERQFGYSISYTPSHSGDRKGGVESSHRSVHAALDHKVPGSTRGRPRKRGELLPVIDGVLTYHEYMREFLKFVVWHNTNEEVPHLAPDDFILNHPDLPATRTNILQWMRSRGLDVSLDYSYGDMQAILLPDRPAVIRRNGLFLKTVIDGYTVVIPRLRFNSPQFVATGLMAKVKRDGAVIDVRVRMAPHDLSKVYLPHPGGLIRLDNTSTDESIKRDLTLEEWMLVVSDRRKRRLANGDQGREARAQLGLQRAEIVEAAQNELRQQLAEEPKPPSRQKLKGGLKGNVRAESQELKLNGLIPAVATGGPEVRKRKAQATDDQADDIMDSFHSGTALGVGDQA
jgi:hypothetical protein